MMKKRLAAVILAALMMTSVFSVTAFADTVPDEPEPAEIVETESETVAGEEDAAVTETETESPQEEEAISTPTDRGAFELAETGAAIPKITRIVPSANGVNITYSAYDGAAKYFIFIEKNGGGWKKIGESSTTSFEYKYPVSGAESKYTVRAADNSGKFISGYDKAGYTFTFLATPTLTAVESINGGQRVGWSAVDGAVGYMVYISNGVTWQAVGFTDKTSYVNADAVSGTKYSYTVRCWDADQRAAQSFYIRRGISGIYVAAPQIIGSAPAKGGLTVKWSASAGAPKYASFVKNGGKWKKLGNTADTSFTHTGLVDGTEYTYTVRCIDAKGAFCSGYNTAGVSFTFIAPPQITGIENGQIAWAEKDAASYYRVYRKEFRKGWEAIGTTGKTVFSDTTAQADTLYTYTVRGLDRDYNLITHFISDDTYYINGKPANGKIKVGGSYLYFENGKVRQGYVTIDGKTYYYNSKGVLQKNGLVGSSREGWRYADKDGVVQMNYTGLASNSAGTWYVRNGLLDRTARTAVTSGGVNYIVINGKATAAVTEKQITLFRAFKFLEKCTNDSMSRSEKLAACFDYIIDITTEKNPRIPDTHEVGWPELYANDIFLNQTGNCFSYACSFAYCAKALGYTNIYVCNSEYHGWCEINGLVYDPQQTKYNATPFYALSYDSGLIDSFAAAIDDSIWWTHVAI